MHPYPPGRTGRFPSVFILLLLASACGDRDPSGRDPTPPQPPALGDPAAPPGDPTTPPADPGTIPTAECGNGTVETGEDCDDGNQDNADACPDGAAGSCQPAVCGDAFIRQDISDVSDPDYEACDDGPLNSDVAEDACRSDCRPARCGDGVVDQLELCDDGQANSDSTPDACRSDCEPARCGDGVLDAGEVCDDGAANADDGVGCNTSCRAGGCGDGVLGANEECDDGTDNSDTQVGACRTDCRLPYCGDGVIDAPDECNLTVYHPNAYPTRIATDSTGRFFVSDAARGAIFIYDSSMNAVAEIKGIGSPLGVARVGANRLYVGNGAERRVDLYDLGGERIGTVGAERIERPTDLTLDAANNLYVVDGTLKKVIVFDPAGHWLRDIGTPDDGTAPVADDELRFPISAIVATRPGQSSPELFVADQGLYRVAVFSLDGTLLRVFGEQRVYVDDWQGAFAKIQALELDAAGRLHALDCGLTNVQILDATTGTYLGHYGAFGSGEGQLRLPLDLILTSTGAAAVTDAENQRIEVFDPIP